MNPYTPSLASSERSDPNSNSPFRTIFAGWFSMQVFVAFALIGSVGFAEGVPAACDVAIYDQEIYDQEREPIARS
jgi:hypothetical protein